MKPFYIISLSIITLFLTACGGSSSTPSPSYNDNSEDLVFADKYPLFADIELTNGDLTLYDVDSYQPVAASNSDSLVGTWLVIDHSIYSYDGYWVYDQLDVRNMTRKLVSIIQAADDSYWIITSNREAEVFVLVREQSAIYMEYPIYGVSGYVDGELINNNRINASLQNYSPVDVTASEITFLKVSNTPTLGGLMSGNTQTIGDIRHNLSNNYTGDIKTNVAQRPVHYFEDGYQETIFYNDGDIDEHLETELIIVSSMRENIDDFIASPSSNDDWQKMWSDTYYYWNDFSLLTNNLTTQHTAFFSGDLNKYYFDASFVTQQATEAGFSIYYDNQLASQYENSDDEMPLYTASMDIEVDFSNVEL